MNAVTGEHLSDLYTSETWHELFTTLSDSLGFPLSIYSQTGRPLFVPPVAHPLCRRFRESSPSLDEQCKARCYPLMMNTLATGKPEVFKCYANIMSFALPIEYLEEKASSWARVRSPPMRISARAWTS